MDNKKVAKELVVIAKELVSRKWSEDLDADDKRERAVSEFKKHTGGEKVIAEKIKGNWYVFSTEIGAYRLARKYRVNWKDIGESRNAHPGAWYVKI